MLRDADERAMIDSHAHLDMDRFDADRDAVVRRAEAVGVHTILSLAMIDEADSYVGAFEVVDRYGLYTAVGCHPHDAKIFDDKGGEDLVRRLADRDRLVAVGEIGLDYHYNLSPPEHQQAVFRRQLRLAIELSLPVIIHLRDASADFCRIVEEERTDDLRGILHSFTADLNTAEFAIARGFLVSFSGILTFKNAAGLREVAAELPAECLLVETDCPYLAPVPHRGKRNEPAMVRDTAECLADLRSVGVDEIESQTDSNFRRFFGL